MEAGRYRILEAIGRGGMAEVYRSVAIGPEGFEKEVVVKRILPRLAKKPDLARMIVDEAKIASRLDHPNIVQIVDLGMIDDEFFLVMELVRGLDLGRVVRQLEARGERVPAGTALRIVAEVCRALDYAHRQVDASGKPLGIVHRDVSPQNVLLSSEGAVKLGDFGIARAAGVGGNTSAGLLKGKIGYVAPEQVLDVGVDGRTDLYAAGIVLYELLVGRHPFATDNDAETLRRARSPQIVPPSAARPALDPNLDALVMRALAVDPARRYATGSEMLHAIEAYLRDHAIAVTATDVAALVRQATLTPTAEEPAVDLDGVFADEIERLGADASSGLSRFTRTRDLRPPLEATMPAGAAVAQAEVATAIRPGSGSLRVAGMRGGGGRWGWVAAGLLGLVLVGGASWAIVGAMDTRGAVADPPQTRGAVTDPPQTRAAGADPRRAGTRPPPPPTPSPTPSPTTSTFTTTSTSPEGRADAGVRPRGPGHRVHDTAPPEGPAAPPETPAAPGTLRIGSSPHWARITVDGAVRGTTPLVLTLPPGPHSIVATNPELGRSETRRVNVPAGGAASVRFDPF